MFRYVYRRLHRGLFMPFVSRAQNFLKDQGPLCGDQYCGMMIETVRYMLDNAIGISNATSTKKILEHLKSKGYKVKREEWQVSVLNPLRKNGIYIGSTRNKGMFLLGEPHDAEIAAEFIEDQIQKQTTQLHLLKKYVEEVRWEI